MADPADDEPVTPLPETDDEDDSIVERVRDLVDDTRTAVEAEMAWQTARGGFVGGRLPGIAMAGALAVLCAFVALLSLAFGAILALTPLIGAVLATLAVVGVLLVLALIAGLSARGRVRRLKTVAFPAKPGATP